MFYLKATISILLTFISYTLITSGVYQNEKKSIVVLYTKSDVVVPDLPDNCCEYIPLEGFHNTTRKAKTVILAGHGKPPIYASHTIKEVSEAIASFDPELVVMNSCYGSADILLDGLAKTGLKSMVVAPPFPIYLPGFTYDANFLNSELSVEERAKSVRTEPYYPILKWNINTKDLIEAKRKVNTMSKTELKKNLRRVFPPLIRVKMPTKLEPNAEVLVMVPPEKLK
jgi:hypothetical protein